MQFFSQEKAQSVEVPVIKTGGDFCSTYVVFCQGGYTISPICQSGELLQNQSTDTHECWYKGKQIHQ